MVREKVKKKKTKLSQQQCLSSEEDSIESDQELMDLYEEEQKKDDAKEENIEAIVTMLNADDISDDSAQLEEYTQKFDQDEEMVQCVPELVVFTPADRKINSEAKRRPRVKNTPTRRKHNENNHVTKVEKRNIPKQSPTLPSRPVNSESCDQDDFLKAKKEGTWIQCSKIDCLKWRKMPNDIEPNALPDRWVCAMNTDLSRTDCTASQETCDSETDFDVVYTPFVVGSLVWAKVPGYPWWPGMIEDDPDYNCCYETDDSNVNPISYHVSFTFDKEVSRSWVSYLGIRNFTEVENPNEIGSKQKKYTKGLSKAISQARKAMNLSLTERLNKYSFSLLYKGQIGYQTDEKPQKMKKRKQVRRSRSPEDTTKKPIFIKQEKKQSPTDSNVIKSKKKAIKQSPTDSENSSINSSSVAKKKLKKRKRVLPSSDEEDSSEKTDGATKDATGDNDCRVNISEIAYDQQDLNVTTEKIKDTSQTQIEADNDNDKLNKGKENTKEAEKTKKTKVKSTKRLKTSQTKSEVTAAKKTKRKSTQFDQAEAAATTPMNSSKDSCGDEAKVKKKKAKKSEEKATISIGKQAKLKKKAKFVNPTTVKQQILNKSKKDDQYTRNNEAVPEADESESLCEEKSTKDSVESVGDSDWLVKESSSEEETTHMEENVTFVESENLTVKITEKSDDIKSTNSKKKFSSFKPKKKVLSTKDETKFVLKPKRFDMCLAFGKKSTPVKTPEKKMRKIKKLTSPVNKENGAANQQENACANLSEISLKGSSLKTRDAKTKHTKKKKQTFGKFKAPVKAGSKITPSKVQLNNIGSQKQKDSEKVSKKPDSEKFSKKSDSKKSAKKLHSRNSSNEAELTLEEVLEISTLDDPRRNPENYVNINYLEKDISNLYQELSEKAASNGNDLTEDDHNLTEASDCVTMEFLDNQISRHNAGQNAIGRRFNDSPEF